MQVNGDGLADVVASAIEDSRRRKLNREMAAKNIIRSVSGYLADSYPTLVGVGEAAEMLGLPKPRIARLREQGRMPEPIQELAAGPVWLRSEVKLLAEELAEERRTREARRREKEGVTAGA